MALREGLAALLAGLAVVVAARAAAPGAVPSMAQYTSAVTSLNAALNGGGAPPRLRDPAFAAMIRTAFDERIVTRFAALPGFQGIDACQPGLTAAKDYLIWISGGRASGFTPAQVAEIRRKEVLYQDEATIGVRFLLACLDMQVTAAERFWKSLPAAQRTDMRRSGVAMMRTGMAEEFESILIMQSDPISAANRAILLDAALRHADSVSAQLSPVERAAVLSRIAITLAKGFPPDVTAKLRRLQAAMSRTDCTGLCAI